MVDFIARCEDAGFDGVGVHDHPHRGRDVYMTLAWRPFRDTAALEAWGRQVGESLPPPAELARYREPYYWAAFALTATGR